ncbi:hypothetical protein OROHE_014384 [Orobanche hederae]
MAVPRIKLGSQGFEVSKQGLGCMGMSAFQGPARPIPDMIKLIHHAIDSGVTFLDTSDVYGPHTNEILIGKYYTCVIWSDMLDAKHRTSELRRVMPEIEEEDHPLIRGFLAKDDDLIPEKEEVEPEMGTSVSRSKFNWLSKYNFTSF